MGWMDRWAAREQAKSDRQLARSRARYKALNELPPDQLRLLDRWEARELRQARLDMLRHEWRPRWDDADFRKAPPPAVSRPDGVPVRVMVHGPRVPYQMVTMPDSHYPGGLLALVILVVTGLYAIGVWAVREVLHIRDYCVKARVDGERAPMIERRFRTLSGAERYAVEVIARIQRDGTTAPTPGSAS